jgi:hypothetical protein
MFKEVDQISCCNKPCYECNVAHQNSGRSAELMQLKCNTSENPQECPPVGFFVCLAAMVKVFSVRTLIESEREAAIMLSSNIRSLGTKT